MLSFTYLFVDKATCNAGPSYFCGMANFIYEGRVYYSPIELTMTFIGGTWKMPILLALRKGTLRYGELRAAIAHINDKMLWTELRDLEKKGMIERKVYRSKPPRTDYMLTDLGKLSIRLIDKLNDFGKHLMQQQGIQPE